MSLGNGNPTEGDKGSNFDFERKSLKLLQAIATASASSGTVSSVGLSMPTEFTVSNSPVTTSATLTVTKNSQTANTVYAAPDVTNGAPTFRALVTDDLPENSKLCTYQLNGFSAAGLTARALLLLSPSSANDAFLYGAFNPAAFNVSQTNAANLAILDIGARFRGIVYYEFGVVLASTIGLTANIRPTLGVTSLVSGSVTSTYTNNFGTGANPSSTTTGSITYFSGVINYTPSGTGDQIIFGLAEVGNVQVTNGNMSVFGNLKFVLA